MNIKELAEVSGFSAHTLRYYEKIGLIFNVQRDSSGHRNYSARNIEWINLLKKLKSTGMTLSNIKKMACLIKRGDSSIPERQKMFKMHKKKIESDLADLESCLKIINIKLKKYKTLLS